MATIKPDLHNQQTAIVLGYLRIWQIVGDRKRGIEPLLPVGRSTFLAGVKSGKYPKSVKFAWKKADKKWPHLFEQQIRNLK
jgi:hypothetical protein